MIEHEFPYECLIGGWYIEPNICDELLKFYNDNKEFGISAIKTTHIHDAKIKTGLDLFVDTHTIKNHFINYHNTLAECLQLYLKKYNEANNTEKFKIIEPFKIQYYKKGQGFKVWHFENDGREHMAKRHLVFMTYLNDVERGGETEWYYQKVKVKPEKGLTIIWSADWTFTHKGHTTIDEDKYIITGWFELKK